MSALSDDETIGHSSHHSFTTSFSNLGQHMENYNVEASALHRKLQSKTDALRILRKELERFRTERDQFKLMAETLQLRYSSIKKSTDYCCGSGSGNKTSVAKLLHETRERNIKLTTEVESLKSKLIEMQGDIELLRESNKSVKEQKLQRTPVSTNLGSKTKMSHLSQAAYSSEWQYERANFICHLEHLKKKNAQLAFDCKSLIDEKEELTMERDAYKCKAHRLNHELLAALKANEMHPKFLDIDSVLLENKYLHERLQSCENDLDLAKQSVSKYKSALETKRKKSIMKLGSNSNEENILSHKQVKSLLESGIELPTKTETIQDLKSLCLTLLDNLNDKNLALNHQKRTNKILGTKIAELEQRIQMLSGVDTSSVSSGYSPAQFLLQDYCPSLVDSNDTQTTPTTTTTTTITETETKQRENSLDKTAINTHISNEFVEATAATCTNYSDDCGSSFSTESARSVLSSEYGDLINGANINAATNYNTSSLSEFSSNAFLTYCTPTTPATTSTTDSGLEQRLNTSNATTSALVSSAIEQERQNDLKDLPPDLAALVQKALHELDMREFETKVIIGDTKLSSKLKKQRDSLDEDLVLRNDSKTAAETIDGHKIVAADNANDNVDDDEVAITD